MCYWSCCCGDHALQTTDYPEQAVDCCMALHENIWKKAYELLSKITFLKHNKTNFHLLDCMEKEKENTCCPTRELKSVLSIILHWCTAKLSKSYCRSRSWYRQSLHKKLNFKTRRWPWLDCFLLWRQIFHPQDYSRVSPSVHFPLSPQALTHGDR